MFFAADYPFLDVMWTMAVFFLWVTWIWILVAVLADVFRRHDLSGWGKVGWTVLMIALPFIGVFAYIVGHGRTMAERGAAEQARAYNGAAYNGDAVAQLERANALRESGALTQGEFDTMKTKLLAV